MKKKIKIDDKKIIKILFTISLFSSLLIGLSLIYNFDFSNVYDLLFQSDSGRVINDITEITAIHNRLNVHPLFLLLTEPIYFIIKSIAINKMLSLVIMQALITTISIIFIYKIVSL